MHPEKNVMETWITALEAARQVPRCGAKTRRKVQCQSPAMSNGRCHMHGGKSLGAPCGEKHGKYKDGFHTKEAKSEWLAFRDLMRQAKVLEREVKELTT